MTHGANTNDGIPSWALDPTTGLVMECPVQLRGPCEHIVDKGTFKAWLDQGKDTCPACSGPLKTLSAKVDRVLQERIQTWQHPQEEEKDLSVKEASVEPKNKAHDSIKKAPKQQVSFGTRDDVMHTSCVRPEEKKERWFRDSELTEGCKEEKAEPKKETTQESSVGLLDLSCMESPTHKKDLRESYSNTASSSGFFSVDSELTMDTRGSSPEGNTKRSSVGLLVQRCSQKLTKKLCYKYRSEATKRAGVGGSDKSIGSFRSLASTGSASLLVDKVKQTVTKKHRNGVPVLRTKHYAC